MGRFLIGMLIGTGIGFAGAVLFAPARKQEGEPGGPRSAEEAPGEEGENVLERAQDMLRRVQDRLSEALAEAKEASQEAESKLRAEYRAEVFRGQPAERK